MAEESKQPQQGADSARQPGGGTRGLALIIVIAAVVVAGIILVAGRKQKGQQLVCLVPCGLQGPYGKIKDLYEAEHPQLRITQQVENTALLVRGIESGKFAGDAFFAIGDREIAFLREKGKIDGDATPYAENHIAVLVPIDNPAGLRADHFADVAKADVKQMGLPTSDINSVGYYGEQALKRADLWPTLEKRLVRKEEPSMVGQLAAQKKLQCGILYASCLLEAPEPGGEPTPRKKTRGLAEVPHEYYDPFYCEAAVLTSATNPATARDFIRFWLTDPAQQVLQAAGFGPANARVEVPHGMAARPQQSASGADEAAR
jgi:molybdenum ABC transporter molybdate-binding protein